MSAFWSELLSLGIILARLDDAKSLPLPMLQGRGRAVRVSRVGIGEVHVVVGHHGRCVAQNALQGLWGATLPQELGGVSVPKLVRVHARDFCRVTVTVELVREGTL